MELYPWTPLVSCWEREKQDTSYPLDLTRNPGDFHIWNWEFGNAEPIYVAAAQFFDTCVPGTHRFNSSCPGSITHGRYGNPCIGGQYNLQTCELFECEDKYYLNQQNVCVLDPALDIPNPGQSTVPKESIGGRSSLSQGNYVQVNWVILVALVIWSLL